LQFRTFVELPFIFRLPEAQRFATYATHDESERIIMSFKMKPAALGFQRSQ
jgi:hypothetical protein